MRSHHIVCAPGRSAGPALLTDRVALVTGGSTGIGEAVVERLVAAGAHVLVHGHLAEQVEPTAARVGGVPLVADLSVPAQRSRLVEQALAAHGRVDILVNNAGIGWSGPFTAMSVPQLRHVLDVDLVAPIELTRLLLPQMVERDEGTVCFVGSIAGRVGVAGEAAYAAAKAGLDMFAESLRLEAAGTGIRIGVVLPAAARTGFFEARGRAYDRAIPRPVAASVVADAVMRAIGGSPEVWVPGWLRIAPMLRALVPGTYRRLSGRFGEQTRLGT